MVNKEADLAGHFNLSERDLAKAYDLTEKDVAQLGGAIGAPKHVWTTQDTEKDLKYSPYSLVRQTLAAYVAMVWMEGQFEMNVQNILRMVRHAVEWLLEARHSLRSKSLPLSEHKALEQRVEKVQETVDTLQNRLDKAINMKKTLSEERRDLIKPMVKEFRDLQKNQVTDLADELENLETPVILDEKVKTRVANVPSAHLMLLEHPELVPAEAKFEDVRAKEQTLKAVLIVASLMRNGDCKNTREFNQRVSPTLTMTFKKFAQEEDELAEKQEKVYSDIKDKLGKMQKQLAEEMKGQKDNARPLSMFENMVVTLPKSAFSPLPMNPAPLSGKG